MGEALKRFTWEEVIEAQRNGKDAYFIPNKLEMTNVLFELKTIELNKIDREKFTTLGEYTEDDCIDDVELVETLIKAYKANEKVPPIILDMKYNIIDGYHRISALYELGKMKIKAFVQCS